VPPRYRHWDKHDTTHYLGKFRTVKVVSEFRNRHFGIPAMSPSVFSKERGGQACLPGAWPANSSVRNSAPPGKKKRPPSSPPLYLSSMTRSPAFRSASIRGQERSKVASNT
jgi:hypothetical protein